MLRIEGEVARSLIAQMRPYRKVVPTLATKMTEPFEIVVMRAGNPSGTIKSPAGTWLAYSEDTGAFYPIPDDSFRKLYEPE